MDGREGEKYEEKNLHKRPKRKITREQEEAGENCVVLIIGTLRYSFDVFIGHVF